MRQKVVILLISICSISTSAYAQQTIITGKVVDSETDSPMSYASIRIKEKAIGVVADGQGKFTLSINSNPDDYTLVVSFVGYRTYEVKLTTFMTSSTKTIKLSPAQYQLDDVVFAEDKFNVKKFAEQAASAYQATSRLTPHLAKANFQERICVKGNPVMFAEGTGYATYLGTMGDWSPMSNYKFLYEQVSVNKDLKPWTDHLAKLKNESQHVFGASVSLNNLRFFELYGPLSKHCQEFKYTLDSAYTTHNQTYLVISFKKGDESGLMIINEDNLQVWWIAYIASNAVWSNAYNDRTSGGFVCEYNYVNGQHYVSQAHSNYRKGDIDYWSKLKIVSQKFDTLELTNDEYVAINTLNRFFIPDAQDKEITFTRYDFTNEDAELRTDFKSGFKGVTIDPAKNPRYIELLTKILAFF